jgi:hypothetical protein
MPYIGRELDRGNYLKLDDISSSFNNSLTTFNLTNGGKAFYPGSAFSILVVLAGVVQEPETAYQINQAQITFASAPLAGDQFFCIALGVALGVNTPANGSVNGTQLAKPFNYDGYFYLDDTNNRVGIATATPQKPLHVVGEGQFDSVRVLGDLTVDGTTTTLDTVVTEVDRLEVGANNNTVGVAITQSGSGDAAIFMGGNVGIGTNNAGQKLHVSGGTGTNIQVQQSNGSLYLGSSGSTRFGLSSGANIIQSTSVDFAIGSYSGHNLIFGTNNARRLSITDQGNFHIQWNNNNFLGSYYDADYYMGLSFGATRRELYIDNRSNDTRADIVFRTVLGQSDPTEKLRITSGGNIGIGNTDTPQSLLEVFGTSPIIRSKHSTSQKYTQINHNGTDGYVDWSSGGLLFRGASNTVRLHIDSSGNVGINKNAPTSVLDVRQTNTGAATEIKLFNLDQSNATTQTAALVMTPDVRANGVKIVAVKEVADMSSSANRDLALTFQTVANNTAVERLRITSGGDVTLTNNLLISEDKKIHFEGSSGDDYNAIWKADTENTVFVTSRFRIANIIDSNNDDSDAYWSVRKDGTTLAGSSELMRVQSDGKVGISEATPDSKLDILHSTSSNSNTENLIHLRTDPGASYVTRGLFIKIGRDGSYDNSAAHYDIVGSAGNSGFHVFEVQGDEKFRITKNGNIGIGTDNPNYLLDVYKSTGTDQDVFSVRGQTSAFLVQCSDLSAANPTWNLRSFAAEDITIKPGNSESVRFKADGAVGIGTAAPDKKLRVEGDARVTGTLTIGEASTVIDGSVEYPTIRPTLDLNFAATKVLDDRITFTRDSVGTYIDENGILKYASNNTPRFDHDPVTGESLGLLIEESRTNILYGTPSQSNTVNTYNLYNSLTGEYNATRLAKNASGNDQSHGSWSWNGNLSTSSFVISAFVKKINHASFFMQVVASGVGDNLYIYYNIDTGVTSHTDYTSPGNLTVTKSIENYPDGWFRLVARVEGFSNAALHSGFRLGFAHPTNNSQQYQDSSDEVLVFGAQAEVGDFATSYIPTHESTTSVTRAADFATIKGTNFTDFYNQTEGTLFGEFTIKDTTYSSAAIANINQEPGSSYVYSIMFVEVGTANGYFGRTYKNSSGINISNSSSVLNSLFPSTTPQKVTFGYTTVSGGELRAYWNGNNVNGSSDLSKVPTTLTNMRIGRGWSGSDVINAHIRKLSYYNKRLPNAQLQGLTQQ